MKSSKVKSICNIMLNIIQIIILIPSIVLEYYATRKMGVIRYLVYKDSVFSKGIFSYNMLIKYKYIFILSLLISIAILVYSIKKVNKPMFVASLVNCFFSIIAILYITYKDSVTLKINTYYYFLISFSVIIVVQYLKMIFLKEKR